MLRTTKLLVSTSSIHRPGDIPPNVALAVALQHLSQHQLALGTVEAWHNVAGSPSFEKASTSKHWDISGSISRFYTSLCCSHNMSNVSIDILALAGICRNHENKACAVALLHPHAVSLRGPVGRAGQHPAKRCGHCVAFDVDLRYLNILSV